MAEGCEELVVLLGQVEHLSGLLSARRVHGRRDVLPGFFPKKGTLVARAAGNTPPACPAGSNLPVFGSRVQALRYGPSDNPVSTSREKLGCCCFNFSKRIVTLKAAA